MASGGVAVAAAAARYAAPPSAAVAASSAHAHSSSSLAANSAVAAASHRNSSQSPRVDSDGYSSGPVGSNGSSGSSGSKGSRGSHPSSAIVSTAAAIRHTFQKPAVPVSLNVYDLHPYNQYLHGLGFGAYHSAVQIFGKGQNSRCTCTALAMHMGPDCRARFRPAAIRAPRLTCLLQWTACCPLSLSLCHQSTRSASTTRPRRACSAWRRRRCPTRSSASRSVRQPARVVCVLVHVLAGRAHHCAGANGSLFCV